MKKLLTLIAAASLAASASQAHARTKLVTLPERAKLIVNLEHPWQSLLAEEREITLQKGENNIDFSWQGVSIDASSIRLSVLTHPGDGPEATKIISVAFPPNEAALTWQLYSPEARTERIRVTYLLNGIGRSNAYEMYVDKAEAKGMLRQYFSLVNASGENLNSAAFRIGRVDDLSRSVESGESRKFLSLEAKELPIRKLFICRPDPYSQRGEEGEPIQMIYEFDNTKEAGLGAFKLDYGKARIFADDPDGTTIFVGEDNSDEVAPREKAELALGMVKDVLLKRRIMSDQREGKRFNKYRQPVLYDRKVHLKYEVENFKDKNATVRVIEQIPLDAKVENPTDPGVSYTRKSGQELEITINLESRPTGTGKEVPIKEINVKYTVPDMM